MLERNIVDAFDCVDASNHILHQFKRTHIFCINNKEINDSSKGSQTVTNGLISYVLTNDHLQYKNSVFQ